MDKKMQNKILLGIMLVLVLLILIVVITGILGSGKKPTAVPDALEMPEKEVKVEYVEVTKTVEVEKEITSEIIADGLRDMGIMITEEYFFTQVENFNSDLYVTLLKDHDFKVPGSNSSFVISYDGTVTAGFDFSEVLVVKHEDTKIITVNIPKPVIFNTTIDPNSFVCYAENQSILNPIKVEDYNDTLISLEEKAREKALERGILEKAEEKARSLVTNFVSSLVDTDTYTVVIRTY